MEITYLGHAAFQLSTDEVTVLVDPFLTGNGAASVSADEVAADAILLTHGHGDHYGDTVAIARRTGASVLAITEIAGELAGQGLEDVRNPNLGGTVTFDWGSVKLVPAWHSSTTPNGTVSPPAGLIITIGATTVYHLGDTALFSDLQLIGARHEIDVALVCIGGHFTMDRHDGAEAARLIGARQVIPCHYNTFPLIAADAPAFKAEVEGSSATEVIVLDPGERHEP